ncbi:hypothetical protein SPRG_12276 [Saprolegnia parasitica CBS 223.65]|uniref:LNR domain-containing protein n=1 Tax=Saprolegnia parasitica (strain CBS 223.65) TaxID=695850 RepID=A0A067C782_SAPPC|nr:hypothetical protein SPRG_12276 [Saprolegnia parasitica CBS 223.65]KDO22647.1 hypothetical protein SPRG_12276 [Saprolegnia parasitica CBS 223.65]|eukprot:XP_012206654.1 hypothetical protein SPRG_12276 [Saprolegnia parasitica CBS 223.65]
MSSKRERLRYGAYVIAILKYVLSAAYCLILGYLVGFSLTTEQLAVQVFAGPTLTAPLFFFAPRLALQAFVTAAQVLQAYHLSERAVNTRLATINAILVGVSAIASPLLLLYAASHPDRKHYYLFFTSLSSFLLATGIAFACIVVPVGYVQVYDLKAINSLAWGTEYTLLIRYLVPNSPLDLLEKMTLRLASWVNVQRLLRAVAPDVTTTVAASTMMSFSPLGPSLTAVKRAVDRPRRRLLFIYVAFHVLLGATVVIYAIVHACRRPTCPSGCRLATAPWFSRACHCTYYHLECLDPDAAVQLSPELLGPDLFHVQLTGCRLEHGFNLSLLVPFKTLFGLTIEFSNLTDWPLGPNGWPDQIMAVNVRYSNLSTIPQALTTLPAQCKTLTIAGSAHLDSLPASLVSSWRHLGSLILNSNQLTAVPSWLDGLTDLEVLVLSGNQIQVVPDAMLAAMPSLTFLKLAQNNLTAFPIDLFASRPELDMDLSNNPIAPLPSLPTALMRAITSGSVVLDGTPLCSSLGSACNGGCSPMCSRSELGDRVCQRNCFDEVCAWDLGDCAGGGSQ